MTHYTRLRKYNPFHSPAGNMHGGEFTTRSAGGAEFFGGGSAQFGAMQAGSHPDPEPLPEYHHSRYRLFDGGFTYFPYAVSEMSAKHAQNIYVRPDGSMVDYVLDGPHREITGSELATHTAMYAKLRGKS